MKRLKNLSLFLMVIIVLGTSTCAFGQNTHYNLTPVKKNKTAKSIDLKRSGSCWSNAGAAFFEAEWMKTGKDEVDISVMDFVHNAYVKKAGLNVKSDGKTRVSENGLAFDVVDLTKEYGFAPESAYMYPNQKMDDKTTGEMDAILRGTLRMAQEHDNSQFAEQWENTYNTALMRYIGETKINFDYKDNTYTPLSFAEYSGLTMDDYILLTSDSESEMNKMIDLKFKQNWEQHQFYNIAVDDVLSTLKNAILSGYSVLWYGDLNENYIFSDESMAIVPNGKMPGTEKNQEEPKDKVELKPIVEKEITPEMRKEVFAEILTGEQKYLLIYGINKDQDGKEYFEAKCVCKSGEFVMNFSQPFIKLNTIFLMLNKGGVPAEVKENLGL